MKEKLCQRIFITKPKIGDPKSIYSGINYQAQGNWTVSAVGKVQTDIMGREFYELILERGQDDPPQEAPEENQAEPLT